MNDAVVVFNRGTGAKVATLNLNLLVRTSTGWAVKYPHVIYDPISGRFILAVLQYNVARSGCSNDGTQVEVAVSNADPTLAWQAPRTLNNEALFAGSDQPVATDVSLGMTSTVVDVSWDYTDCLGTAQPLSQTQTDIIQRADLAAGTLGVNSARFFTGGPAGVQPAMALGLSTVEYQVANDANCNGPAANAFAVFAITGTPDQLNVSQPQCAASGTETHGSSVPPPAPQSGTSATLQTNDDRFLDVVWGANTLWATGNTGCTPSGDTQTRSCINVVTATATTAAAVTVSGTPQLSPEGVSGQYFYYPSLAVDALTPNDVFVTFDESSASTLESMMLATISGGSTWSSFITVRQSTAFYNPGCSVCAWGDFSTAVQDPLHPTDVWIVSEETDGTTGTGCATANTCWNTYIARYTFAAPSVASLTPASGTGNGGQVVTVSGSDFATPGTTATFGGSPITISNLTPDSFTFTTPPGPPAGGTVYIIATDSIGSSTATAGAAYLYVPLADYTPLPPFRILDTRTPPTPLGPNTSRTVQVTGVNGTGTTPVPSTAVAVVINVTEVNGTANSLLTVYPYQTPQPTASNLNFNANTVTPNLVTVTLGNGGRVSIYNSVGTVNVIVDVEGYFAAPTAVTTAGEFHPILPLRVCDTRNTSTTPACRAHGILVAGAPMLVTVTGTGANAIPSDGTAEAAVLNLTAVAGSASAYLTVYPTSSSGTCPTSSSTSTINVVAGATQANRVFVKLGPGPSGPNTAVCVEVSVGKINVLLDANGWFGATGAAAGFQYQAILPSRICDTRKASVGCTTGAIGAGTAAARLVHVAGEGGVPSIASGTVVQAVIANMTAVQPTQNTYLVAYPAGTTTGASDINLGAGAVLPNLIVVQLSTTAGANDGAIDILNAVGTVNAVIDIEGWFQ